MSSAGAIRAGKATVEASLDDAGLAPGLARAQARLAAFGKSLTTIAGVAGVGLGFAAIGAAVNGFAERGTHLLHQAEEVGASVEFMSGLQKGLEFLGGNADSATQALFRFNNKLTEAVQGSAEAQQAFEMLGVDAGKLNGLNTDQRMDIISDAFGKLQSHAERSRVAMQLFGRGGREMIEALSRPGGLKGLREEMQGLGLVMSREQAEKARELHQAFNLLQSSGMSLLNAVLVPLIPVIRDVALGIGNAARFIRDLANVIGAGEWALGFDIACLNMKIAWKDFMDFILDSIPSLRGAIGSLGSVGRSIQSSWIGFASWIAGSSPQRTQQILSDINRNDSAEDRANQADRGRERQRLVDQLNALRARAAALGNRGGENPEGDTIRAISHGTRGTFDSTVAGMLVAPERDPLVVRVQMLLDEQIRARIAVEQMRDQVGAAVAMVGPLVFQ